MLRCCWWICVSLLAACVGPRGRDSGDQRIDAGYGVVVSETLVGPLDALLVDGGKAFLCSRGEGLRVYDITDPAVPALEQTYYADDPCHTLDSTGSRLFTGSDTAFRSYSPNNMLVRGAYSPPYGVYALDASPGENAAWLAGPDPDGTLWLEEVAYREDADMDSRRRVALDAAVATPVALAARPSGLLLLDATGTLHTFDFDLRPLGTWAPDVPVADPSRLHMALGDTDDAYISLGAAGVAIVDVRDLSAPVTAGQWPEDGRGTYGLVLLEGLLYVGLEDALAILSVVEDPAVPAPTGAEDVALTSAPSHIWVTAGLGFLVDAADGVLTVVDLD